MLDARLMRWASGAFLALILLGTAAYLLGAAKAREPCYQGRTLTQWLQPLVGVPSGAAPGRTAAAEAAEAENLLRALGTNSVPFLLGLFERKPSSFKIQINRVLQRQKLVRFRFAAEPDYPELAGRSFLALGDSGHMAIPALVQLLDWRDEEEYAAVSMTLWRMLPASGPALTAALTNNSARVRASAAACLGGPGATASTIELLAAGLSDPDTEARVNMAATYRQLVGPKADDIVLPVLLQCLSEGKVNARCDAARQLSSSSYRARAMLIVPRLALALHDLDPTVRIEAARALVELDPYAATQAGVRDLDHDPSPPARPKHPDPWRLLRPLFATILMIALGSILWRAPSRR